MIKIDLHMHSTVSDGTDRPEEILEKVREAELSVFSVSDHDAIKCSTIIPGLLKSGDSEFITGVEFSCKDEEGKYHILGYGYDPEAESIRKVVETGHNYRMDTVRRRLKFLSEKWNIRFPEEEEPADVPAEVLRRSSFMRSSSCCFCCSCCCSGLVVK